MPTTIPPLRYTRASAADVPELIELGLISYGQYAPFLTPENLAKMQQSIRNEALWADLLSKGTGFICRHEDKLVGMAFLIPSGNPWDVFPAAWSYIRMVGVHPAAEGLGIATKLTKQCIEAAREQNESIIALHTSELMNAARHIYEKLGFQQQYELPERLGVRYWIYSLHL